MDNCASVPATANSPSVKHSVYFFTLEVDAKKRYVEKLSILKTSDPYVQMEKRGWQNITDGLDWHSWPSVEYPDIYNYLIESPNNFIGSLLKAYKSLDAYNFFREWVCGAYSTDGNWCKLSGPWTCEAFTATL